MRAIFSESIQGPSLIEGEEAHHLINVVRIKKGEEILVLNGAGSKIFARAASIEKNKINLEITESLFVEKSDKVHLAIGLPKKDAFEEILRNVTEVGISKVFNFKSEYSQQDYIFNERMKRVLISSLIQSNNPYLPSLDKLADLKALIKIFPQYDKVIYFCSHTKIPSALNLTLGQKDKILIIIGPEGGFSPTEEGLLAKNSSVKSLHLPTFILRAPTAVVASMGWVLGRMI